MRFKHAVKISPPMIHTIPFNATVFGAPSICAIVPASSEPSGAMPINIIA